MNETHINIWQNCLALIREQIEETAYKTWFEPIIPKSLELDTLTLQVPNRFFFEWLEVLNLSNLCQIVLCGIFGEVNVC
jgi:chromosomal replication initiator protein